MRSVAYSAILAIPLALAAVAAPAAAQDAQPFAGPRIEGNIGWDRLQNNGHDSALTYGIAAGYDAALQNGIRVGIDGEVSDSNNKSCYGSYTAADPRQCAKASRDLYIGGRIGKVVTPRTLIYAGVGYTNERIRFTADDGTAHYSLGHDNLDGVRLSAGAEYALFANTYVKAEYRYSNYEQGFTRNQIVGGFGVRF